MMGVVADSGVLWSSIMKESLCGDLIGGSGGGRAGRQDKSCRRSARPSLIVFMSLDRVRSNVSSSALVSARTESNWGRMDWSVF